MYGEETFVVMFGGLYIEMAALRTLVDWLQGRGWVEALAQAEITTVGFHEWCSKREESFPQFQYWATFMSLELCLLVFVRSQRQSSFSMCLDALA